jgi:flagellar basal-body rod modification protein FlgD
MTVTSTSSTTSSSSSTSSSTSSTSSLSTQDQFLKLLIAQLQSQDPLNPMDNAEMTTQLAQISTVQGLNTLNTTVSSMLDQLDTVDQLNATSLIGHTVLVEGDQIVLSYDTDDAAVAAGGFTLDSSASNVVVSVTDSSGNVVDTFDLGSLDAGTHTFSWDGLSSADATMSAGTYSFSVSATNNGTAVTSTALNFGLVDGVRRYSDGTVKLDLGSLGLFSQDSIVQVY